MGAIISLAAVGIVVTCFFAEGYMPDPILLFIVFLVTFSSYTINRLSDMRGEDVINHPQRTKYLSKIKNLELAVLLFLFVAVILTFMYGNLLSFVTILAFPLTVVLYSYKFFSKKTSYFLKQFRLKQVLFVKNILVAAVWGLLALLVTFWVSKPIEITTLVMFSFVFLRIFVGCIVFDLRDVVGDARHRIDTIPIVFGRAATFNLLLFLNTLSGLLLLISVFLHLLPAYFVSLLLIVFYGYYYILESFKKNANLRFICDVLVDGEYFFWGVVLSFGYLLLGR